MIKGKSNKINLTVVRSAREKKNVIVYPEEPLWILLELLNIKDKTLKFIYEQSTYEIATTLTFEEIGITNNSRISIISHGYSGGN